MVMASPLGYVYSRADALKRQLYDMITNPKDYASMLGGRIVEGGQQREALMNQAFADPTNPLKITNERALAQLTDQIMQGELGITPLGMTAYHGSPKGPISTFDLEKVGTGAGTTNFGYGTYFAEHPTIAGAYRKGRIPSSDNPEGFLYKVDIPDEMIPKMLNWYEEVPESIRKNLSDKATQEFGSGLTGTTGEKLYKDLAFSFKMQGSKTPEKDASKWLSEQGIPGIKYENLQMIRGEGRDTNNYVLFQPEKVKVEQINEQPLEDWISKGLLAP